MTHPTISSINYIDAAQPLRTQILENGQKIKYWEKEYINSRISQIKNNRHKTLFFLLWRTGMRITEALSIERRHVDLDNFTITIRWLKKRKALTRVLPLHPDLRVFLDYFMHNIKQTDRLFPFTRQNADILARRYFGGSCHTFRHSFAVNWIKSGGQLFLLSKMLGHTSVLTTEIYLQVQPVEVGKELIKIEFN